MVARLTSEDDIAKMRKAGELAASVLEMIGEHVQVGVTTEKLNEICHDYIVNVQGAIPAPLDYRGFPKSICTSINHVVCHGIPSDSKRLKQGDIINIDITVIKDGFHGDTSAMFEVGKVDAHNNPVAPPVWRLFERLQALRPGLPALIEWDNAIPPLAQLLAEADQARRIQHAAITTQEAV